MGADGHIRIWRRADVLAEFPDAAELFACLGTHYLDTLDGVEYDHVYWGDNLFIDWRDKDDWYMPHYRTETDTQRAENAERATRLTAFTQWLQEHGTHWEVWT